MKERNPKRLSAPHLQIALDVTLQGRLVLVGETQENNDTTFSLHFYYCLTE
ncbi:hypothetical protein KIN20_009972 [Parelaphostrongylus tenuis]|uniref:Uncharacterized protein n=1 Tax=Parelaphostrongylus tenuis TaxID=148309 RepID=A0AAD5MAI1_PARTN|nr:hypothetical protein KIN20_009972 [Parelaphostrongylus tenuis]